MSISSTPPTTPTAIQLRSLAFRATLFPNLPRDLSDMYDFRNFDFSNPDWTDTLVLLAYNIFNSNYNTVVEKKFLAPIYPHVTFSAEGLLVIAAGGSTERCAADSEGDENPEVLAQASASEAKPKYYRYIRETNYFEVYDTLDEAMGGVGSIDQITAYQLIKTTFPDFEKYRCRITPSSKMLQFSQTVRRKCVRARQVFDAETNHGGLASLVTDTTRLYTPLLRYMTESKRVGRAFAMGQQYRSCLFATDNDYDEATVLYLYYGNAQDWDKETLSKSATFTMDHHSDAISIHVKRPIPLQARLENAYTAMKHHQLIFQSVPQSLLEEVGLRNFFYCANTYISISTTFNRAVKGRIVEYASSLLNLLKNNDDFKPSAIEEPDNWMPQQEISIPYSELDFCNMPPNLIAQRGNAGFSLTLDKFNAFLAAQSDPLPEYFTTKQLKPFFSEDNLKTLKKRGYLYQQPGTRGKYGFGASASPGRCAADSEDNEDPEEYDWSGWERGSEDREERDNKEKKKDDCDYDCDCEDDYDCQLTF